MCIYSHIFINISVYIYIVNINIVYINTKTDRQTFLNINSEHTESLKTSISYTHFIKIKRISLKTTEFEYRLQELKERLVNQGYNKKSID